MLTVKRTLVFSGTTYAFELPAICPHCSYSCTPDITSHSFVGGYALLVLREANCKSPFLAVYSIKGSNSELLCVYPSTRSVEFNECISTLSSRFVELYNQAYAAEQVGHFDLAGCGYRNALEVLIKDFAIKHVGDPGDEVAKLDFFTAIDKYYPDPNTKGLAHGSRILGNDYTHYDQKYTEVKFQAFKEYVEGTIRFIKLHLMAKNLPQKDSDRS